MDDLALKLSSEIDLNKENSNRNNDFLKFSQIRDAKVDSLKNCKRIITAREFEHEKYKIVFNVSSKSIKKCDELCNGWPEKANFFRNLNFKHTKFDIEHADENFVETTSEINAKKSKPFIHNYDIKKFLKFPENLLIRNERKSVIFIF